MFALLSFISFYLLLSFFFPWTLLSNCKFPRLSSRRHRVCILNVFSREKTNFIGFLNNWNFSPILDYHVIWKKRERKRKDEERKNKRDCLKHLNDLIFQFTLISFFFLSPFSFQKIEKNQFIYGRKGLFDGRWFTGRAGLEQTNFAYWKVNVFYKRFYLM